MPTAPVCPQTLSLHLLVERARGASSFWAPFVARLPDQVHGHAQTQSESAEVCPLHAELGGGTLAARLCGVSQNVSSEGVGALSSMSW